jgi:hypothetical protein
MMANLQDWLAATAAIVALAWLLRQAFRHRRRAGVCAGCEHCPMAAGAGAPSAPPRPGFVPLASLERAATGSGTS